MLPLPQLSGVLHAVSGAAGFFLVLLPCFVLSLGSDGGGASGTRDNVVASHSESVLGGLVVYPFIIRPKGQGSQ